VVPGNYDGKAGGFLEKGPGEKKGLLTLQLIGEAKEEVQVRGLIYSPVLQTGGGDAGRGESIRKGREKFRAEEE